MNDLTQNSIIDRIKKFQCDLENISAAFESIKSI